MALLTAVATDWTRAVLGVPGYELQHPARSAVSIGTCTSRSTFRPIRSKLESEPRHHAWRRCSGIAIENDGYIASHRRRSTPGLRRCKKVLLHVAFGDHQVAPVTAENDGAHRSMPKIHWPAVVDGRLPDVEPYWGIDRIESYPYDGSAIVIWDSGAPTPPLVNRPPREGEDPHEDPRADADARLQKAAFLSSDGEVIDVCDGLPCVADRE